MWRDNTLKTVSQTHTLAIVKYELSRTVSDIVADDTWPQILGSLFELSMAPDAGKRETAYRVFATTPGIIEKQHEVAVMEAFSRGFKDESVAVSA